VATAILLRHSAPYRLALASCWQYNGTSLATCQGVSRGNRHRIVGVAESFQAMHDRECAARELGLPEEHVVAMVLTFGYPESTESMHRGIVRTPLAELVHQERW
jgi:hypothetical protein